MLQRSNPEMDKVVEAANVETDPAKRAAMLSPLY